MGIHRPGNHGVTIVTDAPDFLTVCGVQGHDHIAARTDDLLPSLDGDERGGAEGKRLFGPSIAGRAPRDGPIAPIQSYDHLLIRTVDAENQMPAHQQGGTAVSMHRLIAQALLPPHTPPCLSVQASCAHVPEMNEHLPALHDRRGTRMAILRMNPRRRGPILMEHLDIPEHFARRGFQAQGAQ